VSAHTLLCSLLATAVLTTLLSGSQGIGLTRISLPFVLGSVFTPDRNRAYVAGFAIHFLNGWLFSLGYLEVFTTFGWSGWWEGAAVGLFHGIFVLVVLMPLLPNVHPRMATEDYGPSPTRQLEPPGFLALNYGRRTPVVTLLAHVVYGAILGACHGQLVH
jgi:uncharacterized membrane protein YagU involved in acid resistance